MMNIISGGVCAAKGFKANGVHCGINSFGFDTGFNMLNLPHTGEDILLALNIGNAEIAIGVWDTEAAPPVLRFTAAISARMHRSISPHQSPFG